jgi:hypothetical protein
MPAPSSWRRRGSPTSRSPTSSGTGTAARCTTSSTTLARDRKEAVEDHQQLELARLDALQAALWDNAMAGDVEAAREVRAVIMARCRLAA